VRALIAPKPNERDLHEIPEAVRNGLTWHFVSSMDEVLELALRRPVGASGARGKRRPARLPAPPSLGVTAH
jgi:ATP-dependent Lon protease